MTPPLPPHLRRPRGPVPRLRPPVLLLLPSLRRGGPAPAHHALALQSNQRPHKPTPLPHRARHGAKTAGCRLAEPTTTTPHPHRGGQSCTLPLLARLPRPRSPSHAAFTPTSPPPPAHPPADASTDRIVMLCTIGYGDITPASPAAKLFAISFVLIGFGFGDILLSGMVSYVLDLQEHLLITAIKNPRSTRKHRHNYIFDIKKGRMRIRMKVALALGVVAICIGVGPIVLRKVESMGWHDAVYLAVMSVNTVGYGDHAFRTLHGRLFASAWLLVSTLAVARAFLYLAEMRIDKRHRAMANWVLSRYMTVSEFLAANIDNNGYVT
ncbi:hypothetical protein ZWY2020_042861 [Hordeum vulgare]|nr:hypothetical protein ZWY2020_042861 [Hordeum vulgare]